MIFQTLMMNIYAIFDRNIDTDHVIKDAKTVPNVPGVILFKGRKGEDVNERCVYAEYTDNMNKTLLMVIRHKKHMFKDYGATEISYVPIMNKLERMNVFLEVVKRYQPLYNFHEEIQEEIRLETLERESKLQRIQKEGEENIFRKLVGNPEEYIKDAGNYESCYDYINSKMYDDTFSFDLARYNGQIPDQSGIYFIYGKDHRLLYVGQSNKIRSRLGEHAAGTTHTWDIKDNFHHIRILSLDRSELDKYEIYFINKYKPLLNVKDTYTYVHQRYNEKYNKTFKEYVSIENYKRMQYAKDLIRKENIFEEIEKMKNYFIKL